MVFPFDGSEFKIRLGGILQCEAEILEAMHDRLLLHFLVIQHLAIGLDLKDGVREHQCAQDKSLHAVFFGDAFEYCELEQVFAHGIGLKAIASQLVAVFHPLVAHCFQNLQRSSIV